MRVPEIVAATKAVHDLLVELEPTYAAYLVACTPPPRRVRTEGRRLSGLCLTAAVLLRDQLVDLGLDAKLVFARTVYGNRLHAAVLVDGVIADPTRWQFDKDVRWCVGQAQLDDRHGAPCTWEVDDVPPRWAATQHPRNTFRVLGLGEFAG